MPTFVSWREHGIRVDPEDEWILRKYAWKIKKDDTRSYVHILLERQNLQELARFILSVTDSALQVDHRDGNGLNNCRQNLRPCTQSQNQHNARLRSDNTTGHKGVVKLLRRGKIFYSGEVMKDKKLYTTQSFVNLEDAVEVTKQLRRKLHGEFANDGTHSGAV